MHNGEHERNCVGHSGKPTMCVCDHNPGGECHCPPNECKCDQKHHLVAQTQQGHHCCANGLAHDPGNDSNRELST